MLSDNMMNSGLLRLCLFSLLCVGVTATTVPSTKKRTWMTIGDAAFRQVQAVAPELASIDSRQLRVAGSSEKVHAVVIDESSLAAVAGAIHQRMGQCGGFVVHASEAEARAALDRRRVAASTPAYGIRQRAVVDPMLAGMQEKPIEVTVSTLSAFTNRYCTSRSGVEASNWLMSAWRELAAGREVSTAIEN